MIGYGALSHPEVHQIMGTNKPLIKKETRGFFSPQDIEWIRKHFESLIEVSPEQRISQKIVKELYAFFK